MRSAHAFEVCLVTRGAVDWWAGEDLHRVRAGELYVTAPGEIHGGAEGLLHLADLCWVQVRLSGARALGGLPRGGAARLRSGFEALSLRRFAAPPAAAHAFERLWEEHARRDIWSAIAARSALLSLLIAVLRGHDAAAAAPGGGSLSPEVERARRWMSTRLVDGFNVAEAAAIAGLRPSRFHARFVAEVGLTPGAWRLRYRVEAAKRRLRGRRADHRRCARLRLRHQPVLRDRLPEGHRHDATGVPGRPAAEPPALSRTRPAGGRLPWLLPSSVPSCSSATSPARAAATSPFLRDALAGLGGAGPKTLPCKHLYDARGVELFEAITRLPEYGLTRVELAILRENLPAIAAALGPRVRLVEPGSGSSAKTKELLAALDDPAEYVPVDIAPEFLAAGEASLAAAIPGLRLTPVEADFTEPLRLPPAPAGTRRTVVFFPGSTLGNFAAAGAKHLVDHLAGVAGLATGGAMLIGLDRVKPLDELLPAYDDAAGVTAAFNLNLLHRLNREAGEVVLDPDCFRHEARWNPDAAAVEMHLVAEHAIETELRGRRIRFAAGESIHTESSHKFDDAAIGRLFAGWHVRPFEDDARRFGLYLVEAC